MILLDTDIMIDLLRQYTPAVSWLALLGDEEVALPGYVAMDLPLYTFNAKHYAALPHLRTVEPYQRVP